MNRQTSNRELRDIFAKVRASVPGVAIRTSVMVGYPGETQDDFEELAAFIQDMKFDHLGCFAYSQEEGTVAGRMKDQVPEDEKVVRRDAIMDLQKAISARRLKALVGQVVQVLVTGTSQESDLLLEGRMTTQAPEVDGVVYLSDGPARVGQIQNVEITESHDYDLVGTVIEDFSGQCR
jgi:ribosomal protein S12 methylthiotransferase